MNLQARIFRLPGIDGVPCLTRLFLKLFATLSALLANRPIVQDTVITTALGVAGRSANLLVPFLVGILFGATAATDALFMALGILVLFTGAFGWAVEVVMVPFVAKLRGEGGANLGLFLGGVLPRLALLVIASGLLLVLVTKPLLASLTDLSVESVTLTYTLVLELSPILLLVMISSILSGVLNAYGVFWAPAASTTVAVVLVLGVTLLGKAEFGVHAVVLGCVSGEGCRLLFLWRVFRRIRTYPIPFTLVEGESATEFLKVLSYQSLGMPIAGLPPLINRTIASHWGPGRVSVIEYAEKLFYLPAGLLSSGFLTVVLSYWSRGYQERGAANLRTNVHQTAKVVGYAALATSVLLFSLRYPLTSLALGWGEIAPQRLVEVAQLYGVYVLGILPNLVSLVLGRAHLVLKNTPVLLRSTFVTVGVLLVLNAVLTPRLGLTGIALANVGSQAALSFYLYWSLKRSLKA